MIDCQRALEFRLCLADVGQGSDQGLVDVDPAQEDIFTKTLVVFVGQHPGVVHGGEPQGGNPEMPKVTHVGRSWTYHWIEFDVPVTFIRMPWVTSTESLH